MNRTVYQLWRNLGPYHLVRAEAAAEQLARHGIDLIAVQLAHGEETRDWRIGDLEQRNFEIITLADDPALTLDGGTPSMWPRLRALFENIPPAGVCIAGYDRPEMRTALRWCRRRHTPSVLMSETKWNDSPRPWWKQTVLRYLIGKAGAAQVSGTVAADFLHRLGMPEERIFHPYGVVDNELFAERARSVDRNFDRPYFLSCCRLIESRKNLTTLFRAFAAWRETFSGPFDLVVCGDGEDREMYESLVAELGIAEQVKFAGFLQADDLATLYARATAFVHPAREEPWGLVINEAMAAGLPVLLSDACGCAPDLVRNGENGFLFSPADTLRLTHLLDQIAKLSNAERLKMGQASQKIIRDWSPKAFGKAQVDALAKSGMRLDRPEYVSIPAKCAGVTIPGSFAS